MRKLKIGAIAGTLVLILLTFAGQRQACRATNEAGIPFDSGIRIVKDIPYAGVADTNRSLNLYLPESHPATKLPIVVLIHGGGWSAGDKNDFEGVAEAFVERGYAAVSLNYRLSQQAIFPAQIIDCKAAIRWLRAHAGEYGLDPTRIVVGGHSAGGHLAALLGTTGDVRAFDKGSDLNQSSRVQAALWFAGVSDLVARTLVPGYESEQDPHSGESQLIGGPVLETIGEANAASPIAYVDRNTPPFLLFHGDSDKAVPVAQAIGMYTALLRADVPTELHILKGADHGGPGYFTPLMFDQIDTFLDRALKRTSLNSPQSTLRDGSYRIAPVNAPNLVLDARDSGAADGTAVQINVPQANAMNQTWIFHRHPDGSYTIQPVYNPTLALSVTPGSTANTTPVLLLRDQGQPNQRWKLHRQIDGKYLLTPQIADGSALDNLGGATTPGRPVDIFTSSGYDPHLQWRITSVP